MPGAGGVHRHGDVPPHGSDLLQLPAVEADKGARKRKRIEEEEEVRTLGANGELGEQSLKFSFFQPVMLINVLLS